MVYKYFSFNQTSFLLWKILFENKKNGKKQIATHITTGLFGCLKKEGE